MMGLLNDRKGIASDGLTGLLILILGVSFVGMTIGMIIKGASETNLDSTPTYNSSYVDVYNTFDNTSDSMETMKNKFIDEEGNARTGIGDVLNALFTGVGGLITLLFTFPAIIGAVLTNIFVGMGFVSTEAGNYIILGVYAITALVIATAVYMITRK